VTLLGEQHPEVRRPVRRVEARPCTLGHLAGGLSPPELQRVRFEHDAAAERLAPAGIPEHEPVVPVEDRRLGQGEEGKTRLARLGRPIQEAQLGVELGRSDVDLERSPLGHLVR